MSLELLLLLWISCAKMQMRVLVSRKYKQVKGLAVARLVCYSNIFP